jgi:hypothetical protein
VWVACLASCYLEPDPPVIGNLVFVTSMPMPGTAIQGQAGGDALCNAAAGRAHCPGTFVAWLSVTDVAAPARLGMARGWVRPDGKPFADRISDIVAGRLLYPLRIDETGADVVTHTFAEQIPVATGTHADGTDSSDCTNFTGNASGFNTAGVPDAISGSWTDHSGPACSDDQRIYCFGTDVINDKPTIATDEGKRAFVTTSSFSPGGGIAAADALCASEAADAQLTGEYAAGLATQASAIQSRFGGGPWVRVDGVTVTSDMIEFKAPLGVTAHGVYTTPTEVWIGSDNIGMPASQATDNCDDWMSSTGVGVIGNGGRSDRHALDESTAMPCAPHPIYCFQK